MHILFPINSRKALKCSSWFNRWSLFHLYASKGWNRNAPFQNTASTLSKLFNPIHDRSKINVMTHVYHLAINPISTQGVRQISNNNLNYTVRQMFICIKQLDRLAANQRYPEKVWWMHPSRYHHPSGGMKMSDSHFTKSRWLCFLL